MIYLVMFLVALSAGFLVLALNEVANSQGRLLRRQLSALRIPLPVHVRLAERRARQARRRRLRVIMEALGTRLAVGPRARESIRQWLQQAGFRSHEAVALFLSLRLIISIGAGTLAILALALGTTNALWWALVISLAALSGWSVPFFFIRMRARRRQRAIQTAIPDMLDLLVVCVEAGLGLNQALFRVAQEIDSISSQLAEELAIANLEIRAGAPRMDALRALAGRTGLEDMRALVSMLVQTDRFGTSIGHSLRVHSDTLRTKRRQRAEEQAAKTTIQMLFPLAFFVFPATFVVILGPALFLFRELLGGL
ncbi:MAG: type II secretion system F family protein [Gemmatimonadota bacterium]